MRVVQLLPALNEGGVERGVVELNREYVARGVESVVISAGGKLVPQIEQDGGRHLTFNVRSKNPFTFPFRALQLRRVLRELQPSIVHARSRVPAWLCILANQKLRLPFVTTVHGLHSVNTYSRVMTLGEQVICVGEVIADSIQEHYHTDPAKITVIQRGVDRRVFDPQTVDAQFVADFQKKFNLKNRKVALSVGRLTWWKGHDHFIDAIGILRRSRPEVIGVVVGGVAPGKQRYAEELKARVTRLGLREHIAFAGSQTRMPEIYWLADVLVNASYSKVGNVGRTVAEGLSMNTPVLTTTEKGLGNLVRDGVNGFTIAACDAADLAAKIAKALAIPRADIRATVPEEFTLDHMVAATLEVYRKVLAQRAAVQ